MEQTKQNRHLQGQESETNWAGWQKHAQHTQTAKTKRSLLTCTSCLSLVGSTAIPTLSIIKEQESRAGVKKGHVQLTKGPCTVDIPGPEKSRAELLIFLVLLYHTINQLSTLKKYNPPEKQYWKGKGRKDRGKALQPLIMCLLAIETSVKFGLADSSVLLGRLIH